MKTNFLLLILSLFALNFTNAQIGRLHLSPYQETKIKIGNTDFQINYSRPSMRGRVIFGDLVPYDTWWRTGANRNTTIEFSDDVLVSDQRVKKGKYAIFTKPGKKEWEVILYAETTHWDVPEKLEPSKIAARIMCPSTQMISTKENMSINIDYFTNYEILMKIEWENTSVSIPIQLTTKEIMEKKINRALNGPIAHDYYAAARYEIESGENYEQGLEWIEKAIEVREKSSFWDLRIKSLLLYEMGRKNEAVDEAEKALILAKEENHEYGINEMSRIINKIKAD